LLRFRGLVSRSWEKDWNEDGWKECYWQYLMGKISAEAVVTAGDWGQLQTGK
jgi:hypothetical protein